MNRSTAEKLGLSQRSTIKWNNNDNNNNTNKIQTNSIGITDAQAKQFANLNEKQKLMALHLAKFENRGLEHVEHEKETKEFHDAQSAAAKAQFQREQREKLQQQKLFRLQWLEQGTELHRENMAITQQRKLDQQKFLEKQKQQVLLLKQTKKTDETLEVRGGIEQFERNLERIGIDSSNNTNNNLSNTTSNILTTANDSETKDNNNDALTHIEYLASTLPSVNTQSQLAASHLARIHTQTEADRIAQKDRERRRRKVLIQQNQSLQQAEQQRQEQKFIEKVNFQSEAEKKIAEQIWKTRNYKETIEQNTNYQLEQERLARESAHKQALEKDKSIYEQEKLKYEQNLINELNEYKKIRNDNAKLKHDNNTKYCKDLVNKIVDIAYKATQHRALSDNKLIHPNIWRDWMNLFIAGKSLNNTNNNTNNSIDLQSAISAASNSIIDYPTNTPRKEVKKVDMLNKTKDNANAINPTEEIKNYVDVLDLNRAATNSANNLLDGNDENAEFLDEQYFKSYIQCEGEWTNIPNNNESNAVIDETNRPKSSSGKDKDRKSTSGGKNKPPNIDTSAMANQQPSTTPIPNDIKENRLLGALIQRIIDVASGKELPPDLPEIPSFPLNIAILGKPFSGKHTQAKLMAEKFNLKVLDVNELVKEAIEAYDAESNNNNNKKIKPPINNNNNTNGTSSGPNSARGVSNDANNAISASPKKPVQSNKPGKSVQSSLGQKLKRLTGKEDSISDEIYVQLIVDAIKRLQQVQNESKSDQSETNNDETKDSNTNNPIAASGWILIDFPRTAKQAQLLEKELSGFELSKPIKQGPPKVTKSKSQKRASRIARPLSPLPESGPFNSAINIVFKFDIDNETASRRCLGRRMDPQTNIEYHLDYNEPSMDSIIKERLIKLSQHDYYEQSLPLLFSNYEDNENDLVEWFKLFNNIHIIQTNNNDISEIKENCRNIIRECMEKKEKQINNTTASNNDNKDNIVIREENDNVSNNQNKVVTDGTANNTNTTENNTTTNTSTSESKEIDYLHPKVDNLFEFFGFYDEELASLLSNKFILLETNYTNQVKLLFRNLRRERINNLEYYASIRNNFFRFLRRPDNKQNILEEFIVSVNNIPIDLRGDLQIKEELIYRCDELTENLYKIVDKKKIDNESEINNIQGDNYLDLHCNYYILYYNKLIQYELDRYYTIIRIVQDYFAILKGLVVQDITEPKLYTLPNLVFNNSNKDKDKRKNKNNNSNINNNTNNTTANTSNKTTSASKRKGHSSTKSNAHIDANEYTNPFNEILDLLPTLLITPEQALEQIINETNDYNNKNKRNSSNFASANKSNTSNSTTSTTKTQDNNNNNNEPGSGREHKPAALNNLTTTTSTSTINTGKPKKLNVFIEKKQKTIADQLFDIQLKHIITVENTILINRINKIIKNGYNEIITLRNYFNQQLLPKLDKWLGLRIKGEISSINKLTIYLKQQIEKDLLPPITYELRLDGENIYIDQHLLATQIIKLPNTSNFTLYNNDKFAYRFNLLQLNNLAELLRINSQFDIILNKKLYDLLYKLIICNNRIELEELLPLHWLSFNNNELNGLINLFDPKHSKYIDWRNIIIELGLPESIYNPNLNNLLDIKQQFINNDTDNDGYVNYNEFNKVLFWFEENNNNNSNSNNIYYDNSNQSSIQQIKSFLFNLFATPTNNTNTNTNTNDNNDSGINNNSGVVHYLSMLFYFCYNDSNTNNGWNKVESLLSGYNRSISNLQTSFINRCKPNGIHDHRFQLKNLSKFTG